MLCKSRNSRIPFVALVSGLALMLLSSIDLAGADEPSQRLAVDQEMSDQLLGDLSDDLLEGLDLKRVPVPAPGSRPETQGAAGEASSEASKESQPSPSPSSDALEPLFGEGEDLGAESAASSLAPIGEAMRKVEGRLASGDTSDSTQTLQKQIVDALAKLIEQGAKSGNSSGSGAPSPSPSASTPESQQNQASQQGNSGGNAPGDDPSRDSTDRLGEADHQDARRRQMQAVFKQAWGHLPERVREEMQSAAGEKFLPKYERIIEDYFRRLAEENAAQ